MSRLLFFTQEAFRALRRNGAPSMAAVVTTVVTVILLALMAVGAGRTVINRIANTRTLEAGAAERARQYAALVSEPKIFKLYDAPHALNAEARRDRIHFLIEQLKLRPVSDAVIAAIPDLYQPPAPN